MDKSVCSGLWGLCFYLLAQQGTISLQKALADEEEKESLLDILKNETFNGVKVNDDRRDGKNDEELEMRDSGHGRELDAKVLDPDSDIGHLAESFVDMYNGTAHKELTTKRQFEINIRRYGIVPFEISDVFSNTGCRCVHGKCRATKNNRYRCICESGYTSKYCNKRKKGCKKKSCVHGKCRTTKNNGYRCICKSGYTGKKCNKRKKRITACKKKPCVHGRCRTTKNIGYRCICKSGYTGKHCDKLKKRNTACKRKPCVHGKCRTTKNNGYRCICKSGYTGKNCDKRRKLFDTLKCTFEVWPCFIQNSKNDDFDWKFYAGRTPTSYTGPTIAHGGIIYMYAEMSDTRKENERAVLETRVNLPSGRYCFRMFYHMYGATIKKLRVSYQARGVSNTELWVKSGNQGNRWYEARIDIPKATGTKIFVEAFRGRTEYSDIAIDDLELKRGSCTEIITTPQPPSTPYPFTTPKTGSVYTCNFEPSSSCFLVNAKDDQFDWTVQQGRTNSYGTGPSEAAEGKYYAYIEASYPRRLGDKAFLVSRVNFPTSDYCLYFQYSMYGANIGSIKVYCKFSFGKALLWSKSGNQGDRRWRTAAVNIPAADNIKIYIGGIRGSAFRGDAAIDNVQMVSTKCG